MLVGVHVLVVEICWWCSCVGGVVDVLLMCWGC